MSGIRLDLSSKLHELGRAGEAAHTASDATPLEEGLAEELHDDNEDEGDAAA